MNGLATNYQRASVTCLPQNGNRSVGNRGQAAGETRRRDPQAGTMQRLEQQLAERYPQWFRGRRAVVARPLLRGLGRWSRLSHACEFLASHAHLSGFALVEAAM